MSSEQIELINELIKQINHMLDCFDDMDDRVTKIEQEMAWREAKSNQFGRVKYRVLSKSELDRARDLRWDRYE